MKGVDQKPMNESRMPVGAEYAIRRRTTRREEFLRTMNHIIPWQEWIDYVRPFSPDGSGDDRSIELLLRMYLLQKWFNVPDALMVDSIHDSYAMWLYMGITYLEEPVLDIRALMEFRQKLEASDAGKLLMEAIQSFLRRYGRRIRPGTVIDPAILLEDPDKNPSQPPDPARAAGDDAPSTRRSGRRTESAAPASGFVPPAAPHPAQDPWPRADPFSPAVPAPDAPFQRPAPNPEHCPRPSLPRKSKGRKPKKEKTVSALFGLWVRRIAVIVSFAFFFYLLGTSLYTKALAVLAQRFPDSPWLASLQPAPSPGPSLAAPDPIPPFNLPDWLLNGDLVIESYYDASADIQKSLKTLADGATPASIVSSDPSPKKKLSLTVDGLLDKDTMLSIVALSAQHGTEVSFFPTGMQAAEAPDVVKAIADAGYPVGNYTLRGEAHMESLSPEELVKSFTTAQKILGQITGEPPEQLKGNALEYTDGVLRAAGAAGIAEAVQSTAYLTYHSFKSYEEVRSWVNRMASGSIISVKLSGNLDASEYQPKEIVEQPAIDMESNVSAEAAADLDSLSPSERVLILMEWLLKAIDEANFSPESVALREQNGGVLAEPVQNLRTTQAAVGYAFYGTYERMEEIEGVLGALSGVGGKGTFFVSASDVSEQSETIGQILEAGHSLGIAYYAGATDDYYSVSHQLLQAQALLSERYGYQARTVMQPWGAVGEAVREAASSLGLLLVGYDLSFSREESQKARTADEVVLAAYKTNPDGFQRGKILGYRLGYFERPALLGELLSSLEGTRNVYAITDIYEMATNAQHLYTYPLPEEAILPEVYNRLHSGQLPVPTDDLISHARDHYIGTPTQNSVRQLPGFSQEEIRQLDVSGKVPGAQDTVFLTFDDWGTDVGVTKLLAVLKKHGVKATFFVRTNHVANNPNLLRAIALEGHEIASHTHNHLPLSNNVTGTGIFEELSDEQVTALGEDILASWQALQSIVGDIRLENGKPALSANFRPPTMAMGRKGMLMVFDIGIDYIVNGEYTSQDYMAASTEDLLRELRRNVRSGSVVIMHFSDNSIHTADALDAYFTLNAAGQNRKTYQFARLTDYLQPEPENASP